MKKKKLSIILLVALLILCVVGIILGMTASISPKKMAAQIRTEVITDIQNNNNTADVAAVNSKADEMGLPLAEAVELFASEKANDILTSRSKVVFGFSVIVALLAIATCAIAMMKKEYTTAMLSVGVMEGFFAIVFAMEPMRFSAFFSIDFWLLIISVCIAFIAIAYDVINRYSFDLEFRKRMRRLVIVVIADAVLATLCYFILGDVRADYVAGMLAKYDLSMVWYAIISIFCYAAYLIVFGALITILLAVSVKKNNKK